MRHCRGRCWGTDRVIDLDIKAFFDTIPLGLVMKAVRQHADPGSVLAFEQDLVRLGVDLGNPWRMAPSVR